MSEQLILLLGTLWAGGLFTWIQVCAQFYASDKRREFRWILLGGGLVLLLAGVGLLSVAGWIVPVSALVLALLLAILAIEFRRLRYTWAQQRPQVAPKEPAEGIRFGVGLQLTWLGMIEDRVAPGPTGSSPDGHPDGTFLLEGFLARGGSVKRILLESVNVEEELTGHRWSKPPVGNLWILGAAMRREDEWAYLYRDRFEVPANESFALRLYASDNVAGQQRLFTTGTRFRATIIFDDGHLEGATTQISTTR